MYPWWKYELPDLFLAPTLCLKYIFCLQDCQGELINVGMTVVLRYSADSYTCTMSFLLITVFSIFVGTRLMWDERVCACVCGCVRLFALEMRSRVVSEMQLRCLLVSVERPRCREQAIRLRGRLSC